MALPKVDIQIQNGGLGRVANTDDSVCALVLSGPAATSLAQNVGARVFSLAGAEALGITSASHAHAHAQIGAFFAIATGASLWIILTPDTTTAANVYATNGPADKLLAAAAGAVTLLGHSIKRAAGYAPGSDYFDYDVAAVAGAAQTLAVRYANSFAPVRIILDGSYLNPTKFNAGDALPNLRGVGDRVSVFVGAEAANDRHAAMGRLMGWLASSTVEANIGRVKRGAFMGTGYLTTGVAVGSYVEAQVASLHNAAIVALRSYVGVGGNYITDDPTLAATTSDFGSLARGRVIDKAIRLTYITYVNEINDSIEITDAGKLSPTKVSYLEDIIEDTLNLRMVAAGNASSARAVIDPNQNILATDKIEIEVRIVPVGYLKEIVVKLGFENPANQV